VSDAEYLRRTSITRLTISPEEETLLRDTVSSWKRGCQVAVDKAWGQCRSPFEVQKIAYDDVRERTSLGSQHAILACHQAAENIQSCISRLQMGQKASRPTYTSPTVTYDTRTMTLFPEREQVSLTTLGDHSRVQAGLELPEDQDGHQNQYIDSEKWETTESTLHYRDGGWFLHLGFRKLKAETGETTENGTVLGVDLGIENLAVTSTAYFFSGRELAHNLREFEKARAGLQQAGTRSSHRTLEQLSGRELRYVRDVLHHASNAIVTEALRYKCDVIAFEDLTHIRDRTGASWGHKWAFRTLYAQVEYKAEAVGVSVKQVGAKNTSKRCAECGSLADENRFTRNDFRCQKCGSEANADYNAAKNIGMRYVRRGQQSSRRTGNSQLALKSGTVTPSCGFTAHPEGFEAEFTDKSHPPRAKSLD